MTHRDMDIDDLRNQWNAIDVPAGFDPGLRAERRVASSRVPTLRDSLRRLFLRLTAISAFGVATMVPFGRDHLTLFILTCTFFVVMGAVNLWQAIAVGRVDMATSTVSETLRRVYTIERRRLITRICGITAAVPLLCYMGFTFVSIYGRYMLYGCLAGTVIGGILGILINRRATSLLRQMKSQLETDLPD